MAFLNCLYCLIIGDGDSGFAFPTKVSAGTKAPPGQYFPQEVDRGEGDAMPAAQKTEPVQPGPDAFSIADKSLQNLVAEMTADMVSRLSLSLLGIGMSSVKTYLLSCKHFISNSFNYCTLI